MPSILQLPLRFDPARLQADLASVRPEEWIPHFNTRYHDGGWSGASLRSVGGVQGQIYPDPTVTADYADTELLGRCPYIREVLATLECPVLAVRFLKLAPGSWIREHRDYNLGYEDGEIRLHVPIMTNPGVEFALEGKPIVMEVGECWYVDFNLPHRVSNGGATDRVHLVIDCVVNEWVREIFERAPAEA